MFINNKRDITKDGGREFKPPDKFPEIHCKGCIYYERQREFSLVLKLLFGESGAWNYAQCYESCPKKATKRGQHYKEYQKGYRMRKKCVSGVS